MCSIDDRVSCYMKRCGTLGRVCFFFQAEDGIRDLVRSRGLGDVYKRQGRAEPELASPHFDDDAYQVEMESAPPGLNGVLTGCLLYTSDAADERSSVDLGGRRIIKKKNTQIYPAHPRHKIQSIDERITSCTMNKMQA